MIITNKFVCPTGCGCVINKLNELTEDGYRVKPEYYEIVTQCAIHGAFLDAQSLWNFLKKYHGQQQEPDTCGCSIWFWWDATDSQETHHVVEDPLFTKRCEAHSHIQDATEHHDEVISENQLKNNVVNAIEKLAKTSVISGLVASGEKPEDQKVKWKFNKNRELEISLIGDVSNQGKAEIKTHLGTVFESHKLGKIKIL